MPTFEKSVIETSYNIQILSVTVSHIVISEMLPENI